jgi:uncharacterized protein DUF4249
MNSIRLIVLLSFFLLINSCVTMFIPEISESQDLLVVEGMITDQPEVNTIKLSRSMPLGKRTDAIPLPGCSVMIEDDLGTTYYLDESGPGVYVTDPSEFTGVVGRFYTLRIFTNSFSSGNFSYESIPTYYSYESVPMEMKPVPPIENISYVKEIIEEESEGIKLKEGCQLFLSTNDPADKCKYYKWDYTETWKIMIPYTDVPNRVCWVTNNSNSIMLKNTSVLSENRISNHPFLYISNETDRLKLRYSILVNQYSLNENEYSYWEKVQNITQDVGSLYDITPASTQSNIYCIENPNEKVLGFFSVSAKVSKRIFIDEKFSGTEEPYTVFKCNLDTIYGSAPIQYLGQYIWVVIDGLLDRPSYRITTDVKGCADCTTRGTTIKPLFWNDDK